MLAFRRFKQCLNNKLDFTSKNTVTNHSIVDIWQGTEYATDSGYARVLNMPGFWKYFLIYQGSAYARVTQSSIYTWICLGNTWICHARIHLNMCEHVQIFLDDFCFTFTHVICCLFKWMIILMFRSSSINKFLAKPWHSTSSCMLLYLLYD